MFPRHGKIFPTSFPKLLVSDDSETETSERPYPNIDVSLLEDVGSRRSQISGMYSPASDNIPEHVTEPQTVESSPKPRRPKSSAKNSDSSTSRKIAPTNLVPTNTPAPFHGLSAPSRNPSRLSNLSLVPGTDAPYNTPSITPRPGAPETWVPHRPLSPVVLDRNTTVDSSINVDSTEAGDPLSSDDIVSTESSRKSSMRYSSYLVPTLSVPPFESKLTKRSPQPLALSPYGFSPSSAISLRDVIQNIYHKLSGESSIGAS